MPAANFMPRFAWKVALGRKLTTIRALDKNGRAIWKAGDRFAAFTGMRQPGCVRLLESTVTHADPIEIDDELGAAVGGSLQRVKVHGTDVSGTALEALATGDGFRDTEAMLEFFEDGLTGQLIQWEAREAEVADLFALVARTLRGVRFLFSNEAQYQAQLAETLTLAGCPFEREYLLTKQDRPDFFIKTRGGTGIAIETKVKGSTLSATLRQMKRYASHPAVRGVLLVASRPANLPPTLSGKPVACLSTWEGGL